MTAFDQLPIETLFLLEGLTGIHNFALDVGNLRVAIHEEIKAAINRRYEQQSKHFKEEA